jgi:hypothetical protein
MSESSLLPYIIVSIEQDVWLKLEIFFQYSMMPPFSVK